MSVAERTTAAREYDRKRLIASKKSRDAGSTITSPSAIKCMDTSSRLLSPTVVRDQNRNVIIVNFSMDYILYINPCHHPPFHPSNVLSSWRISSRMLPSLMAVEVD